MSKKMLKKLLYKPAKKKLKKELPHLLKLLFAALVQLITGLQQRKVPHSPQQKPIDKASTGRPAPLRQTPPLSRLASKLTDPALQAKVDQAKAYHQAISQLMQPRASATEQVRVTELTEKVGLWREAIERLAQRVDHFKHNPLIGQDLETVPKSIATLTDKINQERDPTILGELERTLTRRQNQLAALEKVRQMMTWAEIKIESTLSLLGTIHSQLLASQSQNEAADHRRLLMEVDEEVHLLQDHLDALEEVKLGH